MTNTLTVTNAILLPCPFCGGELHDYETYQGLPYFIHDRIKCAIGDFRMPRTPEAIAEWNTRTPATAAFKDNKEKVNKHAL